MIIDFPDTFAKVGPALVRTGKWTPAKTFMNDVMSIPASLKQVGDAGDDRPARRRADVAVGERGADGRLREAVQGEEEG